MKLPSHLSRAGFRRAVCRYLDEITTAASMGEMDMKTHQACIVAMATVIVMVGEESWNEVPEKETREAADWLSREVIHILET